MAAGVLEPSLPHSTLPTLASAQEEWMAVGVLRAGAGGEGGKEVRCPEHGSPAERSTGQAGSTPSLLTSDLEIDRLGSRILCRH